ncbi:hypothetical protein JCM9279_003551 [Rhodotorula babjevae]
MGLADTLGFGKTASFQATVTVHELLQVPLLNAKFRIKWKFKGATHSLVQAGDDALAGAHNHHSHPHHSHRHGFAERFLHPRTALSSSSSHATLPTTPAPASRSSNGTDRDRDRTPSGSRARSRSPYAVYSSEDGDDVRSPTQSPPLSPDARPNRSGTSAFTFPATSSTSNGGGGDTQTLYATPSNRTGTYDSGTTSWSPEGHDGGGGGTSSSKRRGASDLSALASSQNGGSASGGGALPAAAHRPEPKGSTTFVPLRAHTAVFAREITCPVQVALRHVPGSSKYQLQPCPVRLAVHQEVPGEDGKREEERLGEVILDLSQFAAHPLKGGNGGAAGPEGVKDDVRPRRYLLQDCKSNAVLRVSVKMQWIDGEKLFVAPAFRTGQLMTGSSAAKGLDSGRNSPANRSSASIAHKGNVASSTASPTRLSGSTYARSTTSTTSVNRSNSTSSIGSLPGAPSPLSAASSIAAARARPTHSHHRDHHAQGAGARPRKPKKVWHPSSTLSVSDTGFNFGAPSTTSSTHLGGGPGGGDSVGGRGRVPVRSAADIVEGLFNRPLRRTDTDGTVTLSVASTMGDLSARDMLGGGGGAQGGLGEPIELRHGGGLSSGWKAHKARRSAAKSSAAAAAAEARLSGGEASSSKAWSIRPRAREKHRDRDRAPAAAGAAHPGFERTSTSATERVGRTPQEDVPQPTPATYAKVEAPAEAQRQRDRARWLKDVTHAEQGRQAPHPHEQVDVRVQPPTPQLLSSSHGAGGVAVGRPNLGPMRTPSSTSVASSVGTSSTKALSVQWGDRPSSTSSSPASGVSSSARSTSSIELGPRHGGSSPAAAGAAGGAGAGGERRLVPLRSQRSYDALGIARPASSASFSSLVTPPSPDRRDAAPRPPSASATTQGKEPVRAPARRAGPGERAPGGAEWGRSWG